MSCIVLSRLASLRALEQWKALTHLLCECESALSQRPALYAAALRVLRAQLALASSDVFESDDGAHNFLRTALTRLAENAAAATSLPPALAEELRELWAFVHAQFGLDPEALLAAAFDEDDEPTVVEGA